MAAGRALHIPPIVRDHAAVDFVLRPAIRAYQPHRCPFLPGGRATTFMLDARCCSKGRKKLKGKPVPTLNCDGG
jgi:hypothetical protein